MSAQKFCIHEGRELGEDRMECLHPTRTDETLGECVADGCQVRERDVSPPPLPRDMPAALVNALGDRAESSLLAVEDLFRDAYPAATYVQVSCRLARTAGEVSTRPVYQADWSVLVDRPQLRRVVARASTLAGLVAAAKRNVFGKLTDPAPEAPATLAPDGGAAKCADCGEPQPVVGICDGCLERRR